MSAIRYAASISMHACAHGVVHLALHDEAGETFAVASIPIDGAGSLLDDFAEVLELAAAQAESQTAAAAGQQH